MQNFNTATTQCKSLLITGGCGFIGFNFVKYMLVHRPEFKLVVLDKMTYAADPGAAAECESNPNITLYRGDIANTELVQHIFRVHAITDVMHFAAESHVDNSIHSPGVFIQTNVVGTHCLLQVALEHWQANKAAHRFHHISTDEVYGTLQKDDQPFNEATPYQPNSPYSASKAASDHLVRCYHQTFGLNTVITNCSNNYGPGQHDEKLIPTVLRSCLAGNTIPVYGNGTNIRDWLFVEDHCRILAAVFDQGAPGQTYCIGGRNEVTNLDLVKLICNTLDKMFAANPSLRTVFMNCPASKGVQCQTLIQFVADRPGHDFRYAIDDTKLTQTLGDFELVTLAEGLEKTLTACLRKTSVNMASMAV